MTPGASDKTRVLIVDDHPLLREGVSQLIGQQQDMEVCGQADSVETGLAAVERWKPDLILLDLRLGCGDALDMIKTIKSSHPDIHIVVLSQHDESLYAERSLRAGASGYVMKQEAANHVLEAIRTVLTGELYVSRKMTPLILRKLLQPAATPDEDLSKLSDREFHVFQMLGAGLASRQIAAELKLSVKTIETYRENIKHKFGLQSAAELVHYATTWVENGRLPSVGNRMTR